MECTDLLVDGYGRVLEVLESALEELSQDDLDWQPHPDCNSIGWLTWHLTRIQDDHIASLMGEEQLWTKDKWYARFNRPPDPSDLGFGHSSAQVAAFKSPDVQTLLGYYQTVYERSKRYFLALSNSDLDRELNEPWFHPLPTVKIRLISVLSDDLQHAGQIAYVRGLRQGKGWQKY